MSFLRYAQKSCGGSTCNLVQTDLEVRRGGYIRGVCWAWGGGGFESGQFGPTESREAEWDPVPAQETESDHGVFWVITGFGVPSAGRGHVVETGVLELVPGWGPDTPPPLRRLRRSPRTSVCLYLSKPNRSSWGIHSDSSSPSGGTIPPPRSSERKQPRVSLIVWIVRPKWSEIYARLSANLNKSETFFFFLFFGRKRKMRGRSQQNGFPHLNLRKRS